MDKYDKYDLVITDGFCNGCGNFNRRLFLVPGKGYRYRCDVREPGKPSCYQRELNGEETQYQRKEDI